MIHRGLHASPCDGRIDHQPNKRIFFLKKKHKLHIHIYLLGGTAAWKFEADALDDPSPRKFDVESSDRGVSSVNCILANRSSSSDGILCAPPCDCCFLLGPLSAESFDTSLFLDLLLTAVEEVVVVEAELQLNINHILVTRKI